MGALIKACKASLTVKNTGKECNESMGPAAMLFAVPPGLTWTATDLLDFAAYLNTQIHAAKASRIYPLFGPSAPIRKIVNSKEADVLFTAEDGTQIFIRYGVLNRAFGTTEGGLCYAQALASFTKSGFSFIEVDNAGQVLMRKNTDGTYSGLKTTFMFAPSIDLADFKTPAFTNFQVSVKPEEYINHGQILTGDSTITDLVGLLDTDLFVGTAGASSTTKLKFNVKTECAETDLVADLGSPLAVIGNFIVKLKSSGVVQTMSAAAIVSGHMELTGTFIASTAYTVELAAPSVLLANSIDGYEGTDPLTITIP
jgi:hypothetical protein